MLMSTTSYTMIQLLLLFAEKLLYPLIIECFSSMKNFNLLLLTTTENLLWQRLK